MRRDAVYEAAKWGVKISIFTDRGHDVTGLVHVGANDGYEVEYYRKMGIAPVVCFEPLTAAAFRFLERYGGDPEVILYLFALGEKEEIRTLQVAADDGESSFLDGNAEVVSHQEARIWRFDEVGLANLERFNTLVVDVQGMELPVLKGFGECLSQFKFLNIECSRPPKYVGEASVEEVVEWLSTKGYVLFDPLPEGDFHNDVFFMREP